MARATKPGNSNSKNSALGFEATLVDCMFALPGWLFYSTQILFGYWLAVKRATAHPATVRFAR